MPIARLSLGVDVHVYVCGNSNHNKLSMDKNFFPDGLKKRSLWSPSTCCFAVVDSLEYAEEQLGFVYTVCETISIWSSSVFALLKWDALHVIQSLHPPHLCLIYR